MVFRGTSDNAKTVLCTRFLSPEGCRFGDRCNFAHGDEEIRVRPDSGQRYNSEPTGGRSGGQGAFSGRGASWGGSGDTAGGQQYTAGGAHWPTPSNGGGWSSSSAAVGASPGVGSSLGGGGAGLTGAHAELQSVARNLEPGNHGWTQHTAPEGYCYYYNSHSGVSQWERPLALDFPIAR